ncbi:MAG: futalosine hydrolase [Pirellulaceae bacterium]|jgi:futalosine hydrolase
MLSNTLILVPTRFEAAHLFGDGLASRMRNDCGIETEFGGRQSFVGLCGFSLIAAVQAYQILSGLQAQIERVLLVGIGGAFSQDIELSSVVVGDRVRCVDVGIPSASGEWTVEFEGESAGLHDELPLAAVPQLQSLPAGLILSTATCSTSLEMAADRLSRFPDAMVEEMEAYGVAVACQKFQVTLAVLRGISNYAGQRDKSQWKIKESLLSVKECLLRAVSE